MEWPGVVIWLTKQTRQVTYKHGAGLPVGIAVQLKPTFERLSDDVHFPKIFIIFLI